MTHFSWSFPDDYISKDEAVITEMFGENHGVLDIPDHSKPFLLGEYRAYGTPVPLWNSDFEEDFYEVDYPSDRVLFDKLLNTRLAEDITPPEYDELVYRMELMVRNSPYREGVFQKQYNKAIHSRIRRPDYLSDLINEKSSAVVSTLYNFTTDYLPSLPVRFLAWGITRIPANYFKAKLALNEVPISAPAPESMAYVPYETRAAEIMRNIDLEGTTVVVTGASSGIGHEIAKSMGARGATLVLPTRNVAACDQMALQWRTEMKNPSIHCYTCDLARMDSVVGFLKQIKKDKIVPDILVNCAAVLKPFLTESHAGTANIAMGTNLLGHMVLTDGIIGLMDEDISRSNLLSSVAPDFVDLIDPSLSTNSVHSSSVSNSSPQMTTEQGGILNSALAAWKTSLQRDFTSDQTPAPPKPAIGNVRRIVNLTCSAYEDAALRSEEMTADGLGALTGVRAYNVSRLGAIAYTQNTALWLQRTNRSQHIVINAIDPGRTHSTALFDNTFFSYWYTRIGGKWLKRKHIQSPDVAAAAVLRLIFDPSLEGSNGLLYRGYDVTGSPLADKPIPWILKLLGAMEDLKERAVDKTDAWVTTTRLKAKDDAEMAILRPKMEQMRQWYIKQSEDFEKSLELPMPVMPPIGDGNIRPTPNREMIGSKPLGIGPHDAPLIGDELRANWHYITDTYAVQVSELERRLELAPPKPSPEEQAQIDITKAEFEALKRQIMYERRLKSKITSQYAPPTSRADGETWWKWVKAKVNFLTKPTIHE